MEVVLNSHVQRLLRKPEAGILMKCIPCADVVAMIVLKKEVAERSELLTSLMTTVRNWEVDKNKIIYSPHWHTNEIGRRVTARFSPSGKVSWARGPLVKVGDEGGVRVRTHYRKVSDNEIVRIFTIDHRWDRIMHGKPMEILFNGYTAKLRADLLKEDPRAHCIVVGQMTRESSSYIFTTFMQKTELRGDKLAENKSLTRHQIFFDKPPVVTTLESEWDALRNITPDSVEYSKKWWWQYYYF